MTFYPNILQKAKQFLSSYPRPARVLLGALLAIKLVATLFNAVVYDPARQYDPGMHFPALSSCGFYTSIRSYNPPLYHLLSCPVVIGAHIAWLPDRLREFRSTPAGRVSTGFAVEVKAFAKFESQTLQRDLVPFVNSGPVAMARAWNFVFLAAFYALACFFLFPAFLSDWRACTFLSILLLALPGYQRMAVMVNPENLLIDTAAGNRAGGGLFGLCFLQTGTPNPCRQLAGLAAARAKIPAVICRHRRCGLGVVDLSRCDAGARSGFPIRSRILPRQIRRTQPFVRLCRLLHQHVFLRSV
ncbi:MAG: hypothetical protein HY243_04115 [Proteobacteria bacterium]|nr:hypothetical protein [Pseudomonadota bacterium]